MGVCYNQQNTVRRVVCVVELQYADYEKAGALLKKVPINTLFVQAVVCGDVEGTVYADDAQNPGVCHIVHKYGMSLLFGDTENEAFNSWLSAYLTNADKSRDKHEWMQVYPNEWTGRLDAMLGGNLIKKDRKDGTRSDDPGKVVEFTRVNFAFDPERYREAAQKRGKTGYEIVSTTEEMYEDMEGSVIPKYFWRDAAQFVSHGGGYSLICDGEAVSTAFASYRIGDQLEIGIETVEKYWGRGFAFDVCAALIEYCLAHHLTPVWSCRLENTGSYILAQKLGFVPTLYLPYYRLAV
jgi:RimJ/RimL family protein N-acetyltransferase